MPQFKLNAKGRAYDSLSHFAKAYVEAMFFTNCDSGEEREDLANQLGVERLTRASLRNIAADCANFQSMAAAEIAAVLEHGERDLDGIAHDFWFTRQRHGAGFWEGESRGYPGDLGDRLTAIARAFGECHCDIWKGWIHV